MSDSEQSDRMSIDRDRPGGRLHIVIASLVFFAAVHWWVHNHIDLRGLYHAHGIFLRADQTFTAPLFRWDADFAADYFDEPGGPARCASDALSQLFYYRWVGPAVLTGLAVLAFVAAMSVPAAAGTGRPGLGGQRDFLLERFRHLHPLAPRIDRIGDGNRRYFALGNTLPHSFEHYLGVIPRQYSLAHRNRTLRGQGGKQYG